MENTRDIWFVDDSDVFRFIIKSLLEDSGHADRIDFFDDGDRALLRLMELSKTGGGAPKLIFLDLNMTNLGGWQLLDLLNELELDVSVVILSSEVGIRAKVRAEQEPLVKGYLTKPADQSEIEQFIRELAG